MGLVTVFCPLTMTEAGELVVQIADETRLVEECRVKPVELAGHVKITLTPEAVIVSCGGGKGAGTTLKKNGSMVDDRSNPFGFCAAASPLPAKVP